MKITNYVLATNNFYAFSRKLNGIIKPVIEKSYLSEPTIESHDLVDVPEGNVRETFVENRLHL